MTGQTRIPQVFIDDLLARTDIVQIISDAVPLKKAGRNHQGLCPFHKEKTPSFTASHEKQFYYCFGCGAAGNAVNFVMNYHHIDFPAAVDMLAGKLGLDVPRTNSNGQQDTLNRTYPIYPLLEQVTSYYQAQYHQHVEKEAAQEYIRQRNLNDETVRHFGIGYAPPGWNNLLTDLCSEKESIKHLEETGLLVRHETRNNLYDRFRKRIIFPIRDLRGRVVGFGGRALGNEKPKYLNSPESVVFHKSRELYGLYEAKQVQNTPEQLIVVEGYMDVAALAQHGVRNAVATLGTATTSEHVQKLFKHTSQIVFCFDGDGAGRKAAWKAMETVLPAMEDGRKVRFLFLPQNEDPDSVVSRHGAKYFNQLIKQESKTLDDYLFGQLEEEAETHTIDGKAQFAKLAQTYIQRLPRVGTYKQLLTQELARRTELSISQLNTAVGLSSAQKSYAPETKQPYFTSQQYQRTPPEHEAPHIKATSVRRAIKILLEYPDLAEKISLDVFNGSTSHDIELLVTLIKYLQASPVNKSISAIRGSWHNTVLGKEMAEIQMLDISETDPEKELLLLLKDMETGILRLRQKHAANGRERLRAAIRIQEATTGYRTTRHSKPGEQ